MDGLAKSRQFRRDGEAVFVINCPFFVQTETDNAIYRGHYRYLGAKFRPLAYLNEGIEIPFKTYC